MCGSSLLFSFIAALPAILMAVIASVTLNKGLDRWFSDRTEAIIDTSRDRAQAYVKEHSRMLALDSGDRRRVQPASPGPSSEFLRHSPPISPTRRQLRGLSTVQLIRRDRSVIVAGDTPSNVDAPPPPDGYLREPMRPAGADRAGHDELVGGVIKLSGFDDVYLYLARPIDPRVTRNLRADRRECGRIRSSCRRNRFGVQVAFGILFVGVALVVLLSAIWIGLGFADGLVAPIRRLIGAAQQVSSGNLDVQVPARGATGDIGCLPRPSTR